MNAQERYPRRDYDDDIKERGRILSCTIFVICAIFFVIATDLFGLPWVFIPISMGMLTASIIAFFISSKLKFIGFLLNIVLYFFTIFFTSIELGYYEILFLLLIPISLSVIWGGPIGGMIGTGAAVALIILYFRPSYAYHWRQITLLSILMGGPMVILQLYRQAALNILDWVWQELADMRLKLDEALSQRVILKQTQEDLVQANLYLERLSERLTLMTRIAEDARQAKERFLANVSHELRTPLNMIIGFSEMITEHPEIYGPSLPPALLADIAVIQRNSQHLASLVDDILDLSRAEAGRIALMKERVTVQELVDAAVVAVKPLFDSKGLYLRAEIAPEVPPIYCDRTRVRQVILNLLSNAGRFTAKGGVELRVTYYEGDVLFSVADTGPGIAPEDQQRVFEPFEQANTSLTRSAGSTGLGLSISKHFVEMHNGRMWLESELGKGTTVYFRLPVQEPLARDDQNVMRWFNPYVQYEPRVRPSRAPTPAIRPRFIVVETAQTIQRMLQRFYFDAEIISANSLENAMNILEKAPANAIILDSEVAENVIHHIPPIANLPQGTPALICWVPSEKELAKRLGVLDYLVKPIDHSRLMALLDNLGDTVKKILIVDDDHEAVQLLARMLLSAPRRYEILRATHSQRALALMQHDRPDLVLLDLILPDIDGYQLLEIKNKDERIRNIPVIAITGQIASTTLTEGRCVTFVRPPNVPLANLLGRVLAVANEITSPSPQPVDQEPPKTPGE